MQNMCQRSRPVHILRGGSYCWHSLAWRFSRVLYYECSLMFIP